MVPTIAGSATGAVTTAVLIAASTSPMLRRTLKNFGVGALTLSTTFILMLFKIVCPVKGHGQFAFCCSSANQAKNEVSENSGVSEVDDCSALYQYFRAYEEQRIKKRLPWGSLSFFISHLRLK
jgi:hypothetical protein